jgi:pimeloyl-ACP methyl ester carboxylesterase
VPRQTQLSAQADLRQYTTSIAVRDLDAVRSALGYQQINLYGISYGTRVAQHYARRYPQQTRALILDGVVSPQMILGPALAIDAQAALNQLFARCRQDADCQQRFGDVQQSLQSLRVRLQRQPVTVSVADPLTGRPDDLQITEQALAVLLRLASYSSSTAALLPLTVHLAARDNQFLPLANQLLLTTQSVSDVMAYGMHNSVVCAEDVPRFGAHLDKAALAATYLGSSQVEALQTLCAHWPRGQVDDRFYLPLNGDWPVLLLSGSADPVTPAQYARQAAVQLRHAVQIVLPDQGHGQLGAPCMDRVMADFLQRAAQPEQAAQLDRSCLDKVKPAAFFLSLTGAAP